jgi:hypothetical protein
MSATPFLETPSFKFIRAARFLGHNAPHVFQIHEMDIEMLWDRSDSRILAFLKKLAQATCDNGIDHNGNDFPALTQGRCSGVGEFFVYLRRENQ